MYKCVRECLVGPYIHEKETIIHHLRGNDSADEDTYTNGNLPVLWTLHVNVTWLYAYVSSSVLSLPRRRCSIVSVICACIHKYTKNNVCMSTHIDICEYTGRERERE